MKLKIDLNDNNSANGDFWDGGYKGRHLKIGACNSRNRLELAVNFLGAGVYWVDQVPGVGR